MQNLSFLCQWGSANHYTSSEPLLLTSPVLLKLLYLDFLVIATLTGVKWYLTGVLICISSMNGDVEHHFMAYLPFVCLVWKQFSLGSLSTFSRVICIFTIELHEFLVYSGYVVCKYSLPFHRLLFHSLDGFPWWAKFFMSCSFS